MIRTVQKKLLFLAILATLLLMMLYYSKKSTGTDGRTSQGSRVFCIAFIALVGRDRKVEPLMSICFIER